MSRIGVSRFLAALVVLSGGVIAISCPNEAGIMQYCPGHANNGCVGTEAGICEEDDAETIAEHRFAKGYSPNRMVSGGDIGLCWTEYGCFWNVFAERCEKDEASADPSDVAYFNAVWCGS